MTRKLRLTQELVDRLPPRVDEMGPVKVSAPDPDYHARNAAQILGALRKPDELWVFAVGSLIWKPRFSVVERRPGLVKGWHRSFCLGPMLRHRGSPSAPGRMLSLDRGGECTGVALRMDPGNMAVELETLLTLEPPLPPQWLDVETDTDTLPAIAFVIRPDFAMYAPEPPLEELADLLATAVGHVGTMAEYLLNTVTQLEEAGLHDPHLWQLQDMVADRLERLPGAAHHP